MRRFRKGHSDLNAGRGSFSSPRHPYPPALGPIRIRGSLIGLPLPSIQISAATPLHCPDLRMRASNGCPRGAPLIPVLAATPLQGRAEPGSRGCAYLMPALRVPPSDRPKHGRRAELAVRKASSRRNRQGQLVPYLVTQQPKSSGYADAHPEKPNDIKEINGSGERT
jgi:hypothetical protein